jgi:hypothetical protein
VDFVLKHYKDLSPFLRICNTLQLSPDYLIPQEMGDELEMTRSTIVDCDEEMSSYSGSSSGSENMSMMACTEIVRKRRSGWTSMCAKFMANNNINKVSDEDMATILISRRKGIPHRSPLC